MITSKIDNRGRTTIPRHVRRSLKLIVGDEISYSIEDARATLKRSPSLEHPFSVFSEWNGCADRKAYRDL